MDQDVVDRLSDIYACADQLKSFGKYIHHHKKDQAAFDPRYGMQTKSESGERGDGREMEEVASI